MGQILVLIAQPGKVAIIQRLPLIMLRHSIQFQQPCLPHKDGFYLEQVIAMMCNSAKRNIRRPLFKHIAIDAKAVIARQGYKIGILPRAVTQRHALADILGFTFQPLCLQGCHPRMHRQRRQIGYHLIAGRIGLGAAQLIIVRLNMRGHIELKLGHILAVTLHHLGIQHLGHMQNHIVVVAILIVPMHIPIGRFVVNFHITSPHGAANPDLGIRKIRTGIVIQFTRINHFYELAIARSELFQRKKLQLPSIVEQLFHIDYFSLGKIFVHKNTLFFRNFQILSQKIVTLHPK